MDVRNRNPIPAPWLELRAFKIEDPLERLRYLRCEMQKLEAEERTRNSWRVPIRPALWICALGFFGFLPGPRPAATGEIRARTAPGAAASPAPAAPESFRPVWMVDRTDTTQTYSNGLRIDLTYAVSNKPRLRYPVFATAGPASPSSYASLPSGIVYHTTESHLAPFEQQQNGRLKELGRNLLENIRQQKSYHYVIDRFGRVFRVVEESDAANHAGRSVWADSNGVYVNLNWSFLGVAFEGQTAEPVTPAQITSARMLTEMLRARYNIPAGNCVTHAQISVNPDNMRIGAHVDWAAGFPFESVGLPDNYAEPVPSLWAFGFDYDPSLLAQAGGRWPGLDSAEDRLAAQAAAQGLTPARYRTLLQRRYREILKALDSPNSAASQGGN